MSYGDADADAYGPADADSYKPNTEDLDVQPRYVRKDKDSRELTCEWRWTWEAPETKRQPYVGPWMASRDMALAAGREWLNSGHL